jgi:hypothetical protein
VAASKNDITNRSGQPPGAESLRLDLGGRHIALQGSQCCSPFLLGRCLARTEVDAESSVFGGAAGLCGAAIHVATPGDLEVNETSADNGHLELSFQESTGDSTSPQIDLLSCALWHGVLHQNVADLKPTSWLEHACHLRQACMLVRHQVEHTVANHNVRPTIADW